MISSIAVLPDEILTAVLRGIPKPDLKRARLTCRRWSRVGAESLFQRVYFAPRNEEMQMFANITSHPIFSRTITEVIYDGRLYVSAYTGTEQFLCGYYSAFYPEEFDYQLPPNGAYRGLLRALTTAHGDAEEYNQARKVFAQYSDAVATQEDVLTNGKDLKVLLDGFKRLSNLTTLSLLDTFGSDEYQEWPHIEEPQHSKYLDRTAIQLQPFSWLDRPGWDERGPWDIRNDPEWDTRGIDHLFTALSKCCSPIKRVRMGSPPSVVPMQLFGAASPTLQYLQRVASNLVELKIVCQNRAWAFDPKIRKEELSGVTSIITQAKQLHTLSLCLSQQLKLSPINVDNNRLETLSLANVSFAYEDVLTMVMSSKRTLKNLYLRGLMRSTWDDVTWKSLADRCGQMLELHRVSLMAIADSGFVDDDEPYLSHQELLDVAERMLSWADSQALSRQSRDVADVMGSILDSERWIIVTVDTESSNVLAPDEAT